MTANVLPFDRPAATPNLRCAHCGGEWWETAPNLVTDDDRGPFAVVFDTTTRSIGGWSPGPVACVSCGTLAVIE